MGRKVKSKTITKMAALKKNSKRSDSARAIDAVRKAKKVKKTPTDRWAQNPSRSDVKGIDDGSRQAKQRNATAIKHHFGKIGRRGVNKTNARTANRLLVEQTALIKEYLQRLREGPSDHERERLKDKIQFLKQAMAKNQAIAARWQSGFATKQKKPLPQGGDT